MANEAVECEGNCEEHRGSVERVSVCGAAVYWHEFWYCQAAIGQDRHNGLTVEVIEDRGEG